MKLKKITALMLASAMALSLTACGGSSSDSKGGSETPANVDLNAEYTVDELTVSIWDNNQLDGLQKIADKWTETSGVKVKINVVTWDNYWTLLEAGAQGGEMPDVFWMHSNTAQMYME
ncbi:MAG: sugar ABC transporter substrate-binding protein, partial [Lachnospiraceae bacterium]